MYELAPCAATRVKQNVQASDQTVKVIQEAGQFSFVH